MARICRVLVVEDRDAVRELVAGAVARRLSLLPSDNAETMREELQRHAVDAVVVDVEHDDRDRFQLADELRGKGIVCALGAARLGDTAVIELCDGRLARPYGAERLAAEVAVLQQT
jgi:DNA-binding NtrC family response regulator